MTTRLRVKAADAASPLAAQLPRDGRVIRRIADDQKGSSRWYLLVLESPFDVHVSVGEPLPPRLMNVDALLIQSRSDGHELGEVDAPVNILFVERGHHPTGDSFRVAGFFRAGWGLSTPIAAAPSGLHPGRVTVIAAAGLMVVTSLVTIVAYNILQGSDRLPRQVIRFCVTCFVAWHLLRGRQWARWLAVVGGVIAVCVTVSHVMSREQLDLLALYGFIYAAIVLMLLVGPKVSQHFGKIELNHGVRPVVEDRADPVIDVVQGGKMAN